jgi:hypothetical protein
MSNGWARRALLRRVIESARPRRIRARSFAQTGAMRGEAYGWLWGETNFLVRGVAQSVLYASGNGGNLVLVLPTVQ